MSHILGVVGSNHVGSHSRLLVEKVLAAAAASGADTKLIDLQESPFPIFSRDKSSSDGNVTTAREAVLWADGIVLGSPDYHGSMSGVMKNFLDHFYKEIAGRVFGYVCSSHEKGLTAMDHMRTCIRQCYGWSLPYGIGSNPEEDVDAHGEITIEPLVKRLEMMGYDVARYGSLIHSQFKKDLENVGLPGFSAHYR